MEKVSLFSDSGDHLGSGRVSRVMDKLFAGHKVCYEVTVTDFMPAKTVITPR